MPDYSAMILTICGRLDPAVLPELSRLLSTAGLALEPDEDDATQEEIVTAVRRAVAAPAAVNFYGAAAKDGRNDDLEAELRRLGVGYVRIGSPHVMYSASVALWLPGFAEPRHWLADANGVPHLSADEIEIRVQQSTLEAEVLAMRLAQSPPRLRLTEVSNG